MPEVAVAESPLPAEASERYAGKWLAIRDGVVVAAEDGYDDLMANKHGRPDDTIYHVPERGTYFF